jgi:alpha-galactosidase
MLASTGAVLVLLLATALPALSFPPPPPSYNGLALTPPRGFRSWNLFGAAVNQTLLEQVQDALVSRARSVDGVPTSLADLGYSDVGLDDGWQRVDSGPNGKGFHNEAGFPNINTDKFPDMAQMVARAHALNLTAGFYGNNCISASPNASLALFTGDMATFRKFNFDSWKLDSCSGQKDIALWSNLISQTGPPVVVENCHNGPYFPQPSYRPDRPPYCPFNFYRVSVDVEVLYASIFAINLDAMVPFTQMDAHSPLSYPGCWACAWGGCSFPPAPPVLPSPSPPPHPLPTPALTPPAPRAALHHSSDADMLEVGVAPGLHKGEVALTFSEARAHFGAWCVTSSPLVLGLDVRSPQVMDAAWPIISNREALAINEAWAGGAGTRIARAPTNVTFSFCGSQYASGCAVAAWEVWSKPLPNGGAALLVLNHAPAGAVDVSIELAQVPLLACGSGSGSACRVRDVWAHADAGTAAGVFVARAVPPHDSVFVTLS